jgi:predicted dehydrogenase
MAHRGRPRHYKTPFGQDRQAAIIILSAMIRPHDRPAGEAHVTRREFLLRSAATAAAAAALGEPASAAAARQGPPEPVRLGVVGLGNRGTHLLRLALGVPGVQVKALCDLSEDNLARAAEIVLKAQGSEPPRYTKAPSDYSAMIKRDDIDAVLIATPTKWHCPMAIEAMKAGKHVGSEVPAGFQLQELWDLVRTKEATGRRYMLLENYLYMRPNMIVLNMVRAGLFGEPYYAECGYLHDCRFMLFKPDGSLDWWGDWAANNFGSDYPTHAMGPVSKWFGLNDGDRMEYCTSMMTAPRVLKDYTVKRFGADSPQGKIDWALGEFVSTQIRTVNGRVIRLDYDVNSPRPALMPYMLQGTRGLYDSRNGIYIEDGKGERWEKIEKYQDQYDHGYWKREGQKASSAGHGGGDFFAVNDFIEMVRQDREPWVDVYDAASWSVLYWCSHESIASRSKPVDIPDFTNGRWKDPNWRKDNHKPA